jgi:hypothetical protein
MVREFVEDPPIFITPAVAVVPIRIDPLTV